MSVALIVGATASFALPPCPASGYFHNCFGTRTYPNGNKYVGEWKDDKFNGQGTIIFPDGNKYVSEFKDDKMNGRVIHTQPSGAIDEEIWKNGSFQYVLKNPKNAKPSPLKDAFYELTVIKRKSVQSILSDLGLYTSSIDGLYGKGTAVGLTAFNKKNLNDADLKKSANAQKLMSFILEFKSSPTPKSTEMVSDKDVPKKVVAADLSIEEPTEKQIEIKATPVPLSAAQIKESYDAKEFSKAFTDAQTLAVEGNADAQFLLGKMYADGRGTIQVTTAAHMWFNIASMGGNDEAYEQRKAVTAEMTPGAVETAQAMAMTCIQSVYKDCGLVVKPSAKKAEPTLKAVTDLSSLKSHFKDQSPLKRKQIQYALKKLGVYSSSVDGSWGNRTAAAVSSYQKIQELQSATPSELYESVLSKVDVPSSFASAKKVVSKKRSSPKTNKRKPTEVVEKSPQGYTRAQAEAICEPLAEIAGANAIRAYKAENTSIKCQAIGSFTSCNKVSSGGGSWAGIMAQAYNESVAGDDAEEAVMGSCMAKYGWY